MPFNSCTKTSQPKYHHSTTILTLTSKQGLGKAIPYRQNYLPLPSRTSCEYWNGNMGVKIDGRQLHHLHFVDDIVLITPNISQAERMLADFDKAYGKIDLRLNLTRTMFIKNGLVLDTPLTPNGTNISECFSYIYLCQEINMLNDLAPELTRRKRATWEAFKSIENVVKRKMNTRLRSHLFDSTVLPALTYASETWSLRKQDERSPSVIERAVERTMLGVTRFTQLREGIRSSDLRERLKSKMPFCMPNSRR
ncbi:unnamed protein product [Angiostrongylus costaricensis]|uniref:Reverse transcriptase domain-containing protein n=1 Tax=Angiostrongylus costaricensis TaxID=334426 RepID=A0A0R3PZQ1_ANGCS|nr:unnamed protein product [Angiostrongylus costaricensis]